MWIASVHSVILNYLACICVLCLKSKIASSYLSFNCFLHNGMYTIQYVAVADLKGGGGGGGVV